MCELLWSDPQDMNGRSASKRGVGCQFGPDITQQFCEINNLEYVIRHVYFQRFNSHLCMCWRRRIVTAGRWYRIGEINVALRAV